jgi:hypothetical protein
MSICVGISARVPTQQCPYHFKVTIQEVIEYADDNTSEGLFSVASGLGGKEIVWG